MDVAEPLTPLRRNARFQLLWAGAACSTLGTEINRLVLPLALLALTGSAAQAGLVGATLAAAMLLAQMRAGVWVDRHDRRHILLAAQAVQVLNALVLVLSLVAGGAGLLSFVLFAAVDGVCAAFVGNARQVSIRAVVPIAQLRSAFAQEESRSHAGRVLGPAIGGLLFGVSLLAPYLTALVAVAAAWVFALLARVPRRPAPRAEGAGAADGDHAGAAGPSGADSGAADGGRADSAEQAPDPAPARRGLLAETGTALRWLLTQRGLRELCLVLIAMNFFGGGVTLGLIVHIESLGGGSTLTGFVLTGIGIGGLLGALASGWVTARVSAGHLALGVPAVLGACLMLAALPLAPWWPFFPILTFSLVTPALNVAAGAVTAELVPEDMLGRAGSLLAVASMGLTPLGPLLGGVLAGSLGGGWALCIAGAGFVLTAGIGAASPALRRFDAQG